MTSQDRIPGSLRSPTPIPYSILLARLSIPHTYLLHRLQGASLTEKEAPLVMSSKLIFEEEEDMTKEWRLGPLPQAGC